MKLVRKGARVSGYHSSDGKTWLDIDPNQYGHKANNTLLNTTARMWIGLFGSPHSDTAYGDAVFDNVTVTRD